MRALVFLNDASGASGQPDAEALTRLFAEAGVDADVREIGDVEAQIREAGAPDIVVAAGGDGTIRAVAEALAGSATPLGVIPLGTFNHFARGLGIPTVLSAAVQTIATGEAQPIAAGRIGGRLFLNNASLGLAPDVVVLRSESHGSRLGRALTTLPVAVGALLRLRRLRLEADLDGREIRCKTPFVFVTPNDYEPNLFRFAVRSRRADGRLNVFLATPDGPLDLLRMATRVLRGHLDRHLDASVAERAVLTARRPLVRVLLDGDVVRLPSPLVVEGVPDAVHVIVPRGA